MYTAEANTIVRVYYAYVEKLSSEISKTCL